MVEPIGNPDPIMGWSGFESIPPLTQEETERIVVTLVDRSRHPFTREIKYEMSNFDGMRVEDVVNYLRACTGKKVELIAEEFRAEILEGVPVDSAEGPPSPASPRDTEQDPPDTIDTKIAEAQERGDRLYGDATRTADNHGLILTALIQQHYDLLLPHPIPGWLVNAMNAGGKGLRFARPGYREDDGVDSSSYMQLADTGKKKTEPRAE